MPTDDHSPILLITELFPPAIGGSGVLLANVYSRIGMSPVRVITAPSPGTVESLDPAFAVTVASFGPTLGLLSPRSLARQVALARLARRLTTKESVLHCGRALPEGTTALLVNTVSRRAYACWTHGEELRYANESRELRWLLRRVHRGADALFANSMNTARLLVTLGNAEEKIHVVYPGVDANRFQPRVGPSAIRTTLLGNGALLLLQVGRLEARKGHALVLKALAGLDGHEEIRYAIVGDGPEMDRVKRMAADLRLADRVTFVGAVPGKDLPDYYAAADIFVHPNSSGADFEGFGIVFLEAAASGLPVVGGRSGGVPEAVAEGHTGLLVGGDDVDELRAMIIHLAGSPDLRRRLGAAGRARVVDTFTWERAADKVQAIDRGIRDTLRIERGRTRP